MPFLLVSYLKLSVLGVCSITLDLKVLNEPEFTIIIAPVKSWFIKANPLLK